MSITKKIAVNWVASELISILLINSVVHAQVEVTNGSPPSAVSITSPATLPQRQSSEPQQFTRATPPEELPPLAPAPFIKSWELGFWAELNTYRDVRPDSRNLSPSAISGLIKFHLQPQTYFFGAIKFSEGGVAAHAGGDTQAGSSFFTRAYVHHRFSDFLQLQVGLQPLPLGLTNINDSPFMFRSVSRPDVETLILPNPWSENAVMAVGELGSYMQYSVGVFNSLAVQDDAGTRISADSFVRDARQQGLNAQAFDGAISSRIDFKHKNTVLGFSQFYGDASQNQDGLSRASVALIDAHLDWYWRGLNVRSVWARGQLGEAGSLAPADDSVMAEEVSGYYVEVGASLFQMLTGFERPRRELTLWSRYEAYNLHDTVSDGVEADLSLDRELWVYGLAWSPQPELLLKLNYSQRTAKAGADQDTLEVGLAAQY